MPKGIMSLLSMKYAQFQLLLSQKIHLNIIFFLQGIILVIFIDRIAIRSSMKRPSFQLQQIGTKDGVDSSWQRGKVGKVIIGPLKWNQVLLSNFLFPRSIIIFKDRRNEMSKTDFLYHEYCKFVQGGKGQVSSKLASNFQLLLQDFNGFGFNLSNIPFQSDHVAFLVGVLSRSTDVEVSILPLANILLNQILRKRTDIKLPLRNQMIQGVCKWIERDSRVLSSPQLVSNILWLICRCLQGSPCKKVALQLLQQSNLLGTLMKGELDETGEKAICLLLYYFFKQIQGEKRQLSIFKILLPFLQKIKHYQALRHIISALKLLPVQQYYGCSLHQELFQGFLSKFLGNTEVPFSEYVESMEILFYAAGKNLAIMDNITISKLVQYQLTKRGQISQSLLSDISKIIQLQVKDPKILQKYIYLSKFTLTTNPLSRRIFILFHEHISQEEIIDILTNGVSSSLQKLLQNRQDFNIVIKLLICLKRSVMRVGKNNFLWYSCRVLIEKIMKYDVEVMTRSTKEIFQLFLDTFKEEIQFIGVQ